MAEEQQRSKRVKSGIHLPLEEEADRLIYESIKDVTSREEKSDILTPWKEKNRKSREVLSKTGTVDGAVRRGMYHRAYNRVQTHLNSYDGPTRPIKMDSRWQDENEEAMPIISRQMGTVFGVDLGDE